MILNKLISSLILMIIYFQSLNAQCTRFYTVQPGDSCESITINLRVSLLTLVRLNPTINCAVLTPGSRLCYFVQVNVVPSPLCTNFYITNVRDTCEILGIVFELPRQTLLNINQNLDCSNLVVGTRLCVRTPQTNPVIPSSQCTHFYRISETDTCEVISSAFRITTQTFRELNTGLRCSVLPIGERVCVRAGHTYECLFYYRVTPGDTCESLAHAFSVSVQAFINMNPFINCANLAVDQRVCARDSNFNIGNPSLQCRIFYTVFQQDTCDVIATAFHITEDNLRRLNPSLDCSRMPVGQRVCVQGSVQQPTGTIIPSNQCGYYYITAPSDTCIILATVFRLTIDQLVSLNSGLICGLTLPVGQRLCVQSTQTTSTITSTTTSSSSTTPATMTTTSATGVTTQCGLFYQIFPGDSCSTLLNVFRLTAQELIRLNPNLNCNSIEIGQRVCVQAASTTMSTSITFPVITTSTTPTTTSTTTTTTTTTATTTSSTTTSTLPVGSTTTLSSIEMQCGLFYQIFPGDSCSALLNVFRLTAQELIRLNPDLNCSNLQVGQRVCVQLASTSSTSSPTIPFSTSSIESTTTPTTSPTLFTTTSSPTTTSDTTTSTPTPTTTSTTTSSTTTTLPITSIPTTTITSSTTSSTTIVLPNTSSSTIVTSASIPTTTSSPSRIIPARQCSQFYTIFANDNCQDIALAFRTTQESLILLNSGLNCQNIPIGQSLCVIGIPDQTSTTTMLTPPVTVPPQTTPTTQAGIPCATYFNVMDTETCQLIAAVFRISFNQLLQFNPSLNCNALRPGQRLCVASAPPLQCSNSYIVSPGDNCQLIASIFQISVQLLQTLNPSLQCSNLQIGQRICVEGTNINESNQLCNNFYQVYQGDTCFFITSVFRIPQDQLLLANPRLNCSNLIPGTRLCVEPAANIQPTTQLPTSSTSTSTTTTTTTTTPALTTTREIRCELVYTVTQGDTCDLIQIIFGISREMFFEINRGINCSNLSLGQRICLRAF